MTLLKLLGKDYTHVWILMFVLFVVSFLYRRYEAKLAREEGRDNYQAIQDYLLDGDTLDKSKKPILWIYVPYEFNARQWQSFGSRTSMELNQPYLDLTVRSILRHCQDSFTVCMYDDQSFAKLLPGWSIDLRKLADPLLSKMRTLGAMKLLHRYGGLMCPISFLCMKDLVGLYQKGTRNDKMFVCEMVNRTKSSQDEDFYPSLAFCGAPKECEAVSELCHYIQTLASHDQGAESVFLGQFDRWTRKRVEQGQVNLIEGVEIGTKTVGEEPILLDDLMSNHYLDLYKGTYGIYVPANELLRRVAYGWFVRSSAKQVLESDTILGNYLLLSMDDQTKGLLEPVEQSTKPWIGFWKTPLSAPVWGLKPDGLGNHVQKMVTP